MRYIFCVITLLFFSCLQAQTLGFAKPAGGTSNDDGNSIDFDQLGNSYATGCFSGTMVVGTGPGAVTLTSNGGTDIFVTCFNSAGELVWARSFGGSFNDCGTNTKFNDVGMGVNLVISGYFQGTIDFGAFNFSSYGGEDGFVLTLSPFTGSILRASRFGGTGNDVPVSLAPGSVFTTGFFSGTADFDPGPGVFNLVSAGFQDIFILKLDNAGDFVWAKSMGGAFFDGGVSIAVDISGNVVTTGYFSGTIDFDPGLPVFNLVSAGSADIFILKLNASGDFVWAKSIGDASFDASNSIAVDVTGASLITGTFSGTIDFNPGAGTNNLSTTGNNAIFILKLNAAGDFVWTRRFGGVSSDEAFGNSITVDASGNVYTTGSFAGTTDFEPGAGTTNLVSAGLGDIFVSKLDASGNFVWAINMGGASYDAGNSIEVDASGKVYITGIFQGTADFDPGPGMSNLTSAGGNDIFVVKLSQAGGLPVTLTNVKAYQKNAGVQVEWIAQQESNIEQYQVERSANGQQFSQLGTVQAKGSSIVINYSLFDPNPFRGVNYYRIKIIDMSGQITYSQVMKVNISSGPTLITVYPNPVNDNTIVLQMNNLRKGSYTIILTNTLGQQIVTKLINHAGGSATETIEPSKVLAAGIYQLTFTGGEINMTRQVIKK